MCIEVRVTYPRCFHVHLGHELCNKFESDYGCCPRFETHRRIDPFCPTCSKLEYHAHRSAGRLNTQQHQEAMMQTWTMMHPGQSHVPSQLQPQAQHGYVGQQNVANNSKSPSLDSTVSNSSLYSALYSTKSHNPPPPPMEPPIDPALLGPHQFLEYQQRLAMVVVADHRPRLGQ